jgi:hypothetical protein
MAMYSNWGMRQQKADGSRDTPVVTNPTCSSSGTLYQGASSSIKPTEGARSSGITPQGSSNSSKLME